MKDGFNGNRGQKNGKNWGETELEHIDNTLRQSLWMFALLVSMIGVTVSWPLLVS